MISNFNFYLKEPNGSAATLIYLFCSFNGQRLKYSTGEKIQPNYWNDKAQRAKKNYVGYYTLNVYLEKMQQTAQELIRGALTNDKPLDTEILREMLDNTLTGRSGQKLQPIDLLLNYIEVNRSLKRPNTLKKFVTLRNHLIDFQKVKRFSITFDSINTGKFDEAYRSYLINNLEHLNTSVAKDIILIKVFLNWAVKCGYSNNIGYKSFKAKEPDTDLIALDDSELMTLYNYDFSQNKHLEAVRDVFCFQCFTGLRFSDVVKLRKENVNNGYIHIFAQKTRAALEIPLNDYSNEILLKYDYKLPVISNQKTNEQIKKVCKISGIDTRVMVTKFRGVEEIREIKPKYELVVTHTARRTFITLSIERGMHEELIRAITGQKSYKEFRKYSKLTGKATTTAMVKAWNKETVLKVV